MNIRPLADRVLIKPAAAEEKTLGGIIIPDSAKEKPLKGEVVAVGNGTKDEEMVVKNGDTVLYGKYAGTEIELDGHTYTVQDTGGAIAGNRLDLYFDSHEDALRWGVREKVVRWAE